MVLVMHMRQRAMTAIFVDGSANGLKLYTLSNWDGRVIVAPRAKLGDLVQLEESRWPAIYILANTEQTRLYIGETDSLRSRIKQHRKKDFWELLIACTSPSLTKAEVKYLEHVFASRLKENGIKTLESKGGTSSPKLSKTQKDILDEFVDKVSDILTAINSNILGANKETEERAKSSGVAVTCTGPDAEASGVFSENGLLVLKGSKARKQQTATFPLYNQKLREQLLMSGTLRQLNEKQLIFTQDYLFESPSPAAGIVLARSADGWLEWVDGSGTDLKTLDEND